MPELRHAVEQLTPETFKADPDFYKFLLDERKDAREDSWTRRSGVWLTGLLVPIITIAVTYYGTEQQRQETARQQNAQQEETTRQRSAQAAESDRQREFQRQETERKAQEEATKRHIENARLALDMYIKNPALFDPKSSDAPIHMRMLAVISDNDDLKKLFEEMRNKLVQAKIADGATPDVAGVGLPDRIVTVTSGYSYANFLAYIQALPGDVERAKRVIAALRGKSMKVEGPDTKVRTVPSSNEIRYYRPQQADFVARIADDLKNATGETFVPKDLKKPDLSDGIIEIWMGHS